MEFKNINTGSIHAEKVEIGDVTNVFEGLSFLLSDYQAQIKKINSLILETRFN
jgi:hypothetical protein